MLAFSPFLPLLGPFVARQTGTDEGARDFTITVIGIHAVLIGLMVAVGYRQLRLGAESLRNSTESALRQLARITPLRDDEFYPQFLTRMRRATNRVFIAYLATYPPDGTAHRDRKEYYIKQARLLRDNTNITFRRIVRNCPDNREWICTLLQQGNGRPNANLGLLDDSDADDMPLALSIQLIDDVDTWLVAVTGHERKGPHRDVHVSDREFNALMAEYYDRLWKKATVLLDTGRITTAGSAFLGNRGGNE